MLKGIKKFSDHKLEKVRNYFEQTLLSTEEIDPNISIYKLLDLSANKELIRLRSDISFIAAKTVYKSFPACVFLFMINLDDVKVNNVHKPHAERTNIIIDLISGLEKEFITIDSVSYTKEIDKQRGNIALIKAIICDKANNKLNGFLG